MKSFLKSLALLSAFACIAISDTTSFTIHVIGDSTVTNYKDSAYPQTGWGQILGNFFDESRVKINNVAIGGRSSKTFIQEGRLAGLKDAVKPGDFMFIQWGHNDRYFGTNDRQVPADSFPYYVQQYVDSAKKWGATPVLVSPMNMNTGTRNVFTEYNARGMMETIAKNSKIPFVDLNIKSYNYYTKNNATYVSRFLFKTLQAGEYPAYSDGVNDGTTHFQEMGSMNHAQFIAEDLEDELKTATYLSAESKTQLAMLVSALKKRYTINVKTNLPNYSGLITQTQQFAAGSPLTLRVLPNSETFEKWVDDDCKELSTSKIYYGIKTPARNITYTAMFKGGAACQKIAHAAEDIWSSSSVIESSSSSESALIDTALCFTGIADNKWPSPIDMSKPEVSDGSTDTNHENYTGVGFYNISNAVGSKAVYNVTSDQSASNARLMIRYSHAGTTNRPMTIRVDNFDYDVEFPPTADWDTWDTVYVENVWVDALDFKLSIESKEKEGGPNIDMIAFDMKGVYRTGCTPAKTQEKVPEKESPDFAEMLKPVQKVRFDANTGILQTSAGNLDFKVFNALGYEVFSKQMYVANGSVQMLLPGTLGKGRYFVRAKLDGTLALMQQILVK